MTNKELIEMLSKLNPDAEVLINGYPIIGAENLPGYYDGCYAKLIDPKNRFQGLSYCSTGDKIELLSVNLEDILWEADTLDEFDSIKFEYDSYASKWTEPKIKKKIAEIREEFKKHYT